MKRKQIIKLLEDIGKIANFQSQRFNDKEKIQKTITLRLALDIISGHTVKILEELER